MSTARTLDEARLELGTLLGEGVDTGRLTAEEVELMLRLVRDARERQRAELDQGLEAVLGALPRLVRGPARAIVFGGSRD